VLETAILGTDFVWTVFAAEKRFITWGCSRISYP